MVADGIVETVLGIPAEGKSLGDVANPLKRRPEACGGQHLILHTVLAGGSPSLGDPPAAACPVLVVPGLGLDARVEGRTGRLLTAAAAVRVLLLPGYGRTIGADGRPGTDGGAGTDGEDPVSIAALAREVVVTLHGLGEGPAVLVGHSASCAVVAAAAALDPSAVAGLVLVGPTGDPEAQGWSALMRRWLRTAVHEPAWQLPMLMPTYLRTGVVAARAAMDESRLDPLAPSLQRYGGPVLVVRGHLDRICPEQWVEVLAALPTVRPVTLSGAHMIVITRPHHLAAVIDGFLRSIARERMPATEPDLA